MYCSEKTQNDHPISSSAYSSGKRRKLHKAHDKLDDLIKSLSEQTKATDDQINSLTKSIENDANNDDDGFFTMIAKKAKLLSIDNRAWFEDEVWALFQQDKRREEQVKFQQQPHSQNTEFLTQQQRGASFPGTGEFSFLQYLNH